MTDLGVSLHSWLKHVDQVNSLEWYEHAVSRDLACGCKLPSTYCPDWQAANASLRKTGTFWVHWDSSIVDEATIAREARRRRYILLNAWESGIAGKLKAYNPNVQVFCYKDASSTRSYDKNPNPVLLPAGMSYQWAMTNRTGWFLRDSDGRFLEYGDPYGGHWQMDIGNPDYQAMWADNVTKVKSLGFDGILIDNLLWTPDTYHSGAVPAKYPTKEAFQQAYVSFLANTRSKLTAAGLKAIGNLSNARLHTGGWNRYMQYLDGGWDEWWLTFSDTNLLPEYAEGWRRQVKQVADNEAAGKMTLVQPHHSMTSAGRKAFLYALASYWCVAGLRSAITEANATDAYGVPVPWHPEYDWDLGEPIRWYEWAGTNVFKRHFTKGMVVVNANPTNTGNVTIQLGAAYLSDAGASVTSVSLAGTSGAILRKV